MKKKILPLAAMLAFCGAVSAQENIEYRLPPDEILRLTDITPAPAVLIDSEGSRLAFHYRDAYRTLEDLIQPELRLAGLRINPRTNISSGANYSKDLRYKGLRDAEAVRPEGLPQNPNLENFSWSPDETKIAFTNTVARGVELWYADLVLGTAHRLTDATLNANMGTPYVWARDGKSLLVKMLPADRPALTDRSGAIPEGPVVSSSEPGVRAQNRTYQDLLQNSADEADFDIIATSEIWKVSLDATKSQWLPAAIYSSMSYSPDGKYVMAATIERPYSYIVPYHRFPSRTAVYDSAGKPIAVVNEKGLTEAIPQGRMATVEGRRGIGWRADKPATIYWVEALDGGDPARKVEFRDEIFELAAPFTGTPRSVSKTADRFSGITWGDDKTAVVTDGWWNTRLVRTSVINPSKPSEKPVVLFERNSQDAYGDPGRFHTVRNRYGRYVLALNGRTAWLVGEGFGEEGQFPFVDEISLDTGAKKRIFQSEYTDKRLDIIRILDSKQGKFLVRLQSPTEYPNYYIYNSKAKIAPVPVTNFETPRGFDGVHKELIKYRRADGVELSGTLYLPAGYDREKDGRLPLLMWAYPAEYKDAASAGQITDNPNTYTYPRGSSCVFWVARGYAVLNNASFPIIGEGDREPNDTFVEQLIMNAEAAINALDELGCIDRERVAVGGHSYGAFMTANLLTHSNLFAAGIARSGAYNRTLTPFGFQSEERNYWEIPDVYNAMSPFMHADRMKTPLLLIHGAEDNNSGTFTMQSERYFNALKGFGAPARLVLLPGESHGYYARESVMHVLWEQDRWLEKYVKNKGI